MKTRLFAIAALSAAAILSATSALYAQGAMRSIWDGVYTSAQADKGKALFGDNCAKCHGFALEGNDEIPALKGSHFISDWEGQTVADLIDRVHSTMPMDDPGKLSTPSATLVVTYLLQQNQMPAGSTELTDITALHARIDSTKPGG
jgi:mono/diheme cytochrome c family protein